MSRSLQQRFPAAVLICLALAGGHPARGQTYGKPTPGLCFMSKARVLDRSVPGVAANQRMEQLREAVLRELSGERAAIAGQAGLLESQRPIITEAAYEQRAGALALRQQSFQTLENRRNDQLARTRARATERLIAALAPLLAQILSQHGCSAVLESSGAYAINPALDLTSELIAQMNARLGPISFDLEP